MLLVLLISICLFLIADILMSELSGDYKYLYHLNGWLLLTMFVMIWLVGYGSSINLSLYINGSKINVITNQQNIVGFNDKIGTGQIIYASNDSDGITRYYFVLKGKKIKLLQ